MLVLTRKSGERIHIGEDIVVTVLSVDGDRVKIGISAPRPLQVLRGELLDEVASSNRRAAAPSGGIATGLLDELGRMLKKRSKPDGGASEDIPGR